MNPHGSEDDAFERKLHALTSQLARPDPTPAWKADILARARERRRIRAPRWLLATLGMAWMCIGVLWLSTPKVDVTSDNPLSSARLSLPSVTGSFHDAPYTPWEAIIALNANPDFPDLP